jgi:hypothetical protein
MSTGAAPRFSVFLTIIAATLLLAGGAAYYAYAGGAYARPQATCATILRAAGDANLDGFQQASLPGFYRAFVSHFGEAKYEEVAAIYQRVYRLGEPRWEEYHQRAQSAAFSYYDELARRVAELGRAAFVQLSVEERMRLIEDRAQHESFIITAGVKALPPEDGRRIPDPDAFRLGRDRDEFVRREAWSLLPEADRAALGSQAALSSDPTPEKVAFVDRAGLERLEKPYVDAIAGIARAELGDKAAFTFKHGQPLAKAFLQTAAISPASRAECAFPDAVVQGSLFRGVSAWCTLQVPRSGPREPVALTLSLDKHGFTWLVARIEPPLHAVSW